MVPRSHRKRRITAKTRWHGDCTADVMHRWAAMTRSADDTEESSERGLTLLAAAPVSEGARRAHDIKNLVSCISAIALLLERDAAGAKDPFRDRIARLHSVSERLCDLVRRELVAAEPPARAAFCAMEAVRDVVMSAHDRALEAGVRIQLLTEPATLTGDRRAIEEAFFNLVMNAIDATPRGGSVTVSTRMTSTGDHEWTVRDTGCGVSETRLAELGRVHHTSKVGGSGFGLAITQRVIADHGGALRVESREGSGTTFTIFLPG